MDDKIFLLRPLERRVEIVVKNYLRCAQETVKEMTTNYHRIKKYEMIEELIHEGIFYDFMPYDIEKLSPLWFSTINEINYELSELINKILICNYKSSYDSLRRILELAIITLYFLNLENDKTKVINWLKSRENTPRFSDMLRKLVSISFFKEINDQIGLEGKIKKLYWSLSDIVHTKGEEYYIDKLQKTRLIVSMLRLPELNKEILFRTLDKYIELIEIIFLLFAVNQPVLLVGLPLEKKFMAEELPLCGYLMEYQAERLWEIIPDEYHKILKEIIKDDKGVQSMVEWVNSREDII
ncbi:MAG: hypothetical protein GXP49_17230 [Deltaproteobacteria bacterium]|nr:hypothetical protein [Deltaproteobacteria bacterium]